MVNPHLKKEVQKGIFIVQLIFGKNAQNEDVYFYISIRGDKIEAFNSAANNGNFDISQFGSILAQGKGVPDEKTRKKMEDEYRFDHSSISFTENN